MSKRLEIREKRKKRRQKQKFTTILIVVGVVLIFTSILMVPTIQSAVNPVGDFVQPERFSRPLAEANTSGIPEAPVVLQIFSDFGCSHCADFGLTTEKNIYTQYVARGLVYVEYHSVGSLLGHPNSITTAEAAYCAGDQNMFWDFHDLIFANQAYLFSSVSKKIDKTLEAYAEILGLDVDKFNECIKSDKYKQQVSDDYIEALQLGIEVTPSFVLNDKVLVGNLPLVEFQSEIENALTQAGY